MPPIRLLISDVDGTLVTQQKILTPRSLRAAARLKEAGIALAITSGRPPRGVAMLVEPLELTSPIAAFNGGQFVRPDGTILEQHVLPPDIARLAIRSIESHDLDAWVYRGDDWLVRNPHAPHVDREQQTVQFPPKVVTDLEAELDDWVKIVGVSDDSDAVVRCEADLQRQCADRVSASRSQPYYLDVTHPQANKGEVVLWFSRTLGIPTAQIATIGDGPNDVLMFVRSGLSIAMANAAPEVRKAAAHVTLSNDEDGFADAVDRLILPSH